MSGTVVFMKTHYAIFQLICVLRSVTESQGLIRNPQYSQYSMRDKNNFNNHANEILIPHRGKKILIWKPPGLQITQLLFIVLFAEHFLPPWFCLILMMAIQGNGYCMSILFLKMKNKTKQNRYSERWLSLGTNKSTFRCSGFFSSIVPTGYSLPSTISDFSSVWVELLYYLQTLFFCSLIHYLSPLFNLLNWNK